MGNSGSRPSATSCTQCGMVLDREGEFHPYVFCVLKKAGRDPWEDFAWLYEQFTGNSLPAKPPLVRHLPYGNDASVALSGPRVGQVIQERHPSSFPRKIVALDDTHLHCRAGRDGQGQRSKISRKRFKKYDVLVDAP